MERSKKSSKRVGANFHLTVAKDTGEDWLPLFGSVWNSGPRSHSKSVYSTCVCVCVCMCACLNYCTDVYQTFISIPIPIPIG